MARLSIDDKFTRDPRVLRLAKACSWSRWEAMGCLIDVWQLCYDRVTARVALGDLEIVSRVASFAQKLIEADLATLADDGFVRISGAEERIRYLRTAAENGKRGGSAKSAKHTIGKSTAAKPQTNGHASNPRGSLQETLEGRHKCTYPLVPDLPSASASVSAAVPDNPLDTDSDGSARREYSRVRSKKGFEPTPEEQQSARVVLERLSKHNGVRYSGSAEHIRLIVNQLRAGRSEMDLRKVVYYCASEAFPTSKPDMRVYLRPETLFGPKTIDRYLDPARSWFETLDGEVPRE